jgi:hypothetical protein
MTDALNIIYGHWIVTSIFLVLIVFIASELPGRRR